MTISDSEGRWGRDWSWKNNSSELCRMPVDHVCWERCDQQGDEHYHNLAPPPATTPADDERLWHKPLELRFDGLPLGRCSIWDAKGYSLVMDVRRDIAEGLIAAVNTQRPADLGAVTPEQDQGEAEILNSSNAEKAPSLRIYRAKKDS